MAEFVCVVDEDYRSACEELPFYAEYEGKRYCVLHFPGEKKDDFEQVKKDKLERQDYDFRGAMFPVDTSDFEGFEFDAKGDFFGATFVGEANFSKAQFNGETFFTLTQFRGEASFTKAQFNGELTNFSRAQFSGQQADFSGAQFRCETSFTGARFSGGRTFFAEAEFSGQKTEFLGAEFGSERTFFPRAQFRAQETDFSYAQFGSVETHFGEATSHVHLGSGDTPFREVAFTGGVTFEWATFRERVFFLGTVANQVFGSQAWAKFGGSRIEKPELFTFNTVLLHPCWFINVDVRKVDFTDVKWYGMPDGPRGTPEEEIEALTERDVGSPHVLLSQACQRLAANAEDNHDYPLANEFYFWSMEALRKAGWRRFELIRTVYGALSGYGVRPLHAGLVLLAMYALFAVLYILLPSSPFSLFSASVGLTRLHGPITVKRSGSVKGVKEDGQEGQALRA